MEHKIHLSHVAVLVPSVQKAAAVLSRFDFEIGPAEDFEGEGTREIYVSSQSCNSLLLMQPIAAGSYQRALTKRGPGLHHFAVDVLNLEEYLDSLSGSGWLLHPRSLHTMRHSRTAYLARPGFPALVEVQEKKNWQDGSPFVQQVVGPWSAEVLKLTRFVGLVEVLKTYEQAVMLVLNGQSVHLRELTD
ncbi:MAG: VOC family protein [Bdellovibrionales bacterium]